MRILCDGDHVVLEVGSLEFSMTALEADELAGELRLAAELLGLSKRSRVVTWEEYLECGIRAGSGEHVVVLDQRGEVYLTNCEMSLR